MLRSLYSVRANYPSVSTQLLRPIPEELPVEAVNDDPPVVQVGGTPLADISVTLGHLPSAQPPV
jgi:hypothetical protein